MLLHLDSEPMVQTEQAYMYIWNPWDRKGDRNSLMEEYEIATWKGQNLPSNCLNVV